MNILDALSWNLDHAERARLSRLIFWLSAAGTLIYLLLPYEVWAARSPMLWADGKRSLPPYQFQSEFTLFDSFVTDTEDTSRTRWMPRIMAAVTPTFKILAVLELCWAAAIWVVEKDNLNSLAVEMIRKFMMIGFFYTLLLYAPEWIPSIYQSFEVVGQRAAAIPEPITTDMIIATGLALVKMIWSFAPPFTLDGVWGYLDEILVAAGATLGVMVAYFIIAAQYFVVKIECYLLLAAGAIFLGLGSNSFTSEYVNKYLTYMVTVGIRLLVLILIYSLMTENVLDLNEGLFRDMSDAGWRNDRWNVSALASVMALAIVQCVLSVKAPEMATALLTGGIGVGAGSAAGAASSVTGGLTKTAGVAAGAAKMGAAAALGAAAVAGAGVVGAARQATRAVQGGVNFAKAASAGAANARAKGMSAPAAVVAGLGAATTAVGEKLAAKKQPIDSDMKSSLKAAPGAMLNAVKGKSAAERGLKPGVFAQAKEELRGAAQASDASALKKAAAASGPTPQPSKPDKK